jgi:hypothetical protein
MDRQTDKPLWDVWEAWGVRFPKGNVPGETVITVERDRVEVPAK